MGQAKARGPGVTVRKLTELCSALGGRLVLSVEWDAAVLADIVGPARAASVGAECYAGSTSFEEAKARFECKARKGLIKWMTKPGDSAARGAGESEEPSQ